MEKLKVMTILGTRPEIIRLTATISLLEIHTNHVLVHTGQNYDYELNQIFFDELGIKKPDYFLDVDTSSLGRMLGEVLIKTEEVLLKERPDAVLVLGDTNSAIAVMMAKRMKIPTYHMEAGNRSFDSNVPEEINRKVVDHLADYNLVYTEHARRHLISEGIPHRFIYLTGSPMNEVLQEKKKFIGESIILQKLALKENNFFTVSVHREENVDNADSLKKIIHCLRCLYDKYQLPIVVSTHPRTRKRLAELHLKDDNRDIRFLKPFGFYDYNRLQQAAYCTISDSGTISEESAMLGFPAVTIRQSIERPEALDTGSIVITGLEPSVFLTAIEIAINENSERNYTDTPFEYQIENTSLRVVKLILGTAKLTKKWRNLDDFSRCS